MQVEFMPICHAAVDFRSICKSADTCKLQCAPAKANGLRFAAGAKTSIEGFFALPRSQGTNYPREVMHKKKKEKTFPFHPHCTVKYESTTTSTATTTTGSPWLLINHLIAGYLLHFTHRRETSYWPLFGTQQPDFTALQLLVVAGASPAAIVHCVGLRPSSSPYLISCH